MADTLHGVRPGDRRAARQVEAWLLTYARTRDPRLREQIIAAHLGMADRLAGRHRTSHATTTEDLRQSARLGLIAAVDRYRPGRPFTPYAVACILGEVKRHLRDTTWRLAVPRRAKEHALQVCRAADELAGRLGRSPTPAELAETLALTQEQVLEAILAAQTRMACSLDEPAGGDGDTPVGELVAAPDPTVDPEDRILLPQLLAGLPVPERTAVRLYYFEGLTQQGVAERMGHSQMQVSRLLRRAVGRIRGQLVA